MGASKYVCYENPFKSFNDPHEVKLYSNYKGPEA